MGMYAGYYRISDAELEQLRQLEERALLEQAEELTEDERYVLEAFYGEDNQYGSNAADDVADYFQIERASAYRRKNRALERLTTLLFGKA